MSESAPPRMTVEEAMSVAFAVEWYGDYRAIATKLSNAARVLAREVERLRAENPEGETPTLHCLRHMERLPEEERTEVMSHFCKECGSVNPRCQCWNDE